MTRTRIEAGLEALIRAAQASKALGGTVAGVAMRYVEATRRGAPHDRHVHPDRGGQ